MRVLKTRFVAQRARKLGVIDDRLCEAVWRAERGLIDAVLGRFLIKQRIARPGGGRRGGNRAVLFYRSRDLAVFLTLFAKSDKADLRPNEEEAFRGLADEVSRIRPADLRRALSERGWIEVDYEAYTKKVPQ